MGPEPCSTWITPRYLPQNGAVYKGLAIATLNGNQFIYATNFRSGNVDVFDSAYNPVSSLTGTFTDPNPMLGFAPFGITLFGTTIYGSHTRCRIRPSTTRSIRRAQATLISSRPMVCSCERFATGGNLNAPWGMVLTPANFGPLSNDYWIGNFGDGMINAFDAMGNSLGQPTDRNGKPLIVDGLWALVFGNGSNNAATTSLYFTAGPNMEIEGIFGKFDVTTKKKSTGMGGGTGPYAPDARNDVATRWPRPTLAGVTASDWRGWPCRGRRRARQPWRKSPRWERRAVRASRLPLAAMRLG